MKTVLKQRFFILTNCLKIYNMTSTQLMKFSGATKNQLQHAINNLNYPKVRNGSNRIFTPKMVYETCNWLALHYHLNIYQIYPSKIND